ncbi:hypothetical protein L9F63_012548, partial [Diploptera punctata]
LTQSLCTIAYEDWTLLTGNLIQRDSRSLSLAFYIRTYDQLVDNMFKRQILGQVMKLLRLFLSIHLLDSENYRYKFDCAHGGWFKNLITLHIFFIFT